MLEPQDSGLHPDTIAVAAGRGPVEPGGPLTPPVVASTVFHPSANRDYAREGNPTWEAFEEALGALEGGWCLAFGSGMGAIGAVLDLLVDRCPPPPATEPPATEPPVRAGPPPATVVLPVDAYSGFRARVGALAAGGHLVLRPVDIADTAAVVAACAGADLLWVETPTNPLLAVADLPAVCAAGRRAGALVAVDNTFATPLGQRPLDAGAHVAVHSATKLIAGHSDVLLGATVTADEGLNARLWTSRTQLGAVPGPWDAWLALRGLRTLPVRRRVAQDNAGELARRLAAHHGVTRVRYPGLPDDPGHERAAAQLHGFGTIVSVEITGGADAADALCDAVEVATQATSLGGVETTLERRGRQPGEEAVPASLVRISVGCEHVEDLWRDLEQALAAAAAQ